MSQVGNMSYDSIYEIFPCIEHEVSDAIYIPLINKNNEIVSYSLANLSLKDKLLKFRYHLTSKTYKNIKYYACSNHGISMHEIVIGSKSPEGYVIDHINGNGLDNTIINLHHVTKGANAQNKTKSPNTTSKYIGVSYDNNSNKWKSAINYNKKGLYLGIFENEIDAAKIYDVYATFIYKESSPATNNLLTETEIRDIIKNGIPEQYKKIERNLPKNIRLMNGTYCVEVTRNKKGYKEKAKTLEEAIIIKSQIYENINYSKIETSKNITRNKDGLAIIQINSGHECIVDEEHWIELSKYKWKSYLYDGKFTYPSYKVNGEQKTLHRYVYEKYIGEIPSNMSVDHIKSECIFDVRLQNLRLADISLQNHNRNIKRDQFNKYRGVAFRGNGFEVFICDHNYGTYDTAEKAAEKANEVFKLKYGDNAKLNDIDYYKITTKENRIPEEIINKEFIMNTNKVINIKNIIAVKKLNVRNGGTIDMNKIKLSNLEEHKNLIIELLYPSETNLENSTKTEIKYNEIPEDIINKEYIITRKRVADIKNIVITKKLNCKNGGKINIGKINLNNLEQYKSLIIELLYPSSDEEKNDIKQIIDSNSISEEIITKEYIMNRKSVTDLKNIIIKKKLNVMNGGTITTHKINLSNFEEHKSLIIDILYPSSEKDSNLIPETKYDNLHGKIIDKEYIMNIKTVVGLIKFVKERKLNTKNGGEIRIKGINPKNLEEYKKRIIEILYPLREIQ